MGALAPVGPWIPEDDLLLKNAVEAGASLESLAKGAVKFSRKYSVRELQERWHNLLYDPVISAEASALMMQFERSSQMLPLKLNKFGSSKDTKCMSGKRKAGSVRNRYYALRKRISNEPFNPMDLTYIVGPSNNYARSENGHLNGGCMLEDLDSAQFELQDSDFEILHLIDGVIPDEDVEHNTIPNDLGNELGNVELGPEAREFGQSEEILSCSLIEATPEIEDGHVFNSSILDGGASYQGMSIWKGVEGISMPPLPDDITLGEKDLHEGETFIMGDHNDNSASTSGYDLIHPESDMISHVPNNQPEIGDANTEGYFEELSKSLLDFSNEEELLCLDSDVKDGIDQSYYDGLSSLLLNSPRDDNQDEFLVVAEGMMVPSDACFVDESVICPQDTDENMSTDFSHFSSIPHISQTCEQFMFCTLNTEDPEIPCNDGVIFSDHNAPKSDSSKLKCRFQESYSFSLAKEGTINLGRATSLVQSQTSQGVVRHFNQPVGVCSLKAGLSNGDSRLIISNAPNENKSSALRSQHVSSGNLKEEPIENLRNASDASLDKLLDSSDELERLLQLDAGDEPMEAPGALHDPQFTHSEISDDLCIPDSGTRIISSASDLVESDDDDVPSFSDVEAMILDSDLEPDELDLFSNEEVMRYNNEEMRREIVRLEQGARSYMQRAIASNGAFAVLYGRYSKHYIRKTEVLLGRGTEDFKVDIDLAKEGRLNKISRRQAMIKLEKSGYFVLKNLGKCPVLVNDKEIAPGQNLPLTSNCLVEIKGTPFVFETHPQRIKQFLSCITDKS